MSVGACACGTGGGVGQQAHKEAPTPCFSSPATEGGEGQAHPPRMAEAPPPPPDPDMPPPPHHQHTRVAHKHIKVNNTIFDVANIL